jgi:hypothetical protein
MNEGLWDKDVGDADVVDVRLGSVEVLLDVLGVS